MGKRENTESILKKLRREIQSLHTRMSNLERQLGQQEPEFDIGEKVPQSMLEKMIATAKKRDIEEEEYMRSVRE